MKNGAHLDNVLETLDIQQHSLGVAAVLLAKFSLPAGAQDNRYLQAQEFILGCNGEQIRLAPETGRWLRRCTDGLMMVCCSCRAVSCVNGILYRTEHSDEGDTASNQGDF